jgi:hypothetical protein
LNKNPNGQFGKYTTLKPVITTISDSNNNDEGVNTVNTPEESGS